MLSSCLLFFSQKESWLEVNIIIIEAKGMDMEKLKKGMKNTFLSQIPLCRKEVN